MAEVRDNVAAGRFELEEPGGVSFARYRRQPGRLVIPYVEAPPARPRAGAAGRLKAGGGADARRQGLWRACWRRPAPRV